MSALRNTPVARWLRAMGGPHVGFGLGMLVGLILLIFLIMTTQLGSRGGGLGRNIPVLAIFAAAILVAEQLRMRLPGRVETAPLVTALGLAMAFAGERPGGPITYTAGGCILGVGLSLAIAVLPRHLRRTHADTLVNALDTVIRLTGVSLAALLWRSDWIWPDSVSMLERSRGWADVQQASAMVAIGLLVLLGEAPARAAWRSVQEGIRWVQATRDEVRATTGLSAGVAVTGTMIAICLPVLDLAAVPLMILPMVFTQNAVRRQSLIRETYRQTVTALSRMPEVVGITPRGHAQTVATLSVAVARRMGMKEREVNDLEFAALLHDIGQVTLRYPIPGGATVQAAPVDQQRIADDGAAIIRETGVLGSVADIVATQAAPYRRVVEGQERLQVSSRILKVTNAYADYYAAHSASGEAPAHCHAAALERIYLGLGYQFDPLVVTALEQTLERT